MRLDLGITTVTMRETPASMISSASDRARAGEPIAIVSAAAVATGCGRRRQRVGRAPEATTPTISVWSPRRCGGDGAADAGAHADRT